MEKLTKINNEDTNDHFSLPSSDGQSIPFRIIDSVLVILASPVLLILFTGVALLIRVKLGSPIFYSQLRGGYLGNNFRIVKFRSMSSQRDNGGNLLPDAQRLTHFGVRLRAMRLDELPSFYHILRGEMSLVGPRPLLPDTVANNHLGIIRQQVKPGFTGLAQVSGNTLLSEEEKFALDCYYISRVSLCLNMIIILKTLNVIITEEKRDEALIAKALSHCEKFMIDGEAKGSHSS